MRISVISTCFAIALALGGCQVGTAVEKSKRVFDRVCTAATTLHSAFTLMVEDEAIPIPQRTVEREQLAYLRVQAVCTGVRTAASIAEVSGLLDEINDIIKEFD